MKFKVMQQGSALRTSIGSLGASSITLIESEGKKFLVDTGHYGRRKNLLNSFSSSKINTGDIDAVILTHLHWDHALNYDLFPDAEFIIGQEEFEYNEAVSTSDLYAVRHFNKLIEDFHVTKVKSLEFCINNEIKLFKTPGHTPGHIVVLAEDKENKVIITGDALPNGRAFFRGVPDIITSNEQAAKNSAARIKKMAENSIIIPGHDPPFRFQGNSLVYEEQSETEFIFREDRERDFVIKISETVSKSSYH